MSGIRKGKATVMLAVMMTCFVSKLDTGDACNETCVDLSTCTSSAPRVCAKQYYVDTGWLQGGDTRRGSRSSVVATVNNM